jgi:hypothetical protein
MTTGFPNQLRPESYPMAVQFSEPGSRELPPPPVVITGFDPRLSS